MSDADLNFRNQQGDGKAVAVVAGATVAVLVLASLIGPVSAGILVAVAAAGLGGYVFRDLLARHGGNLFKRL